jgi:hypothetical protein
MKRGSKTLFFVLFCLLAPLAAQAKKDAPEGDYRLGDRKEFWVWDLRVMPPAFRRTEATVRAVGPRSYIFVENALWEKNIQASYVEQLHQQLEFRTPEGSINEKTGIIPLQEKIFAPLPKKIRNDERLIVLFADLGKYKNHEFDGFFNAFDQLTEENAWKNFEQHSNEANIVYINGLRGTEEYTTGVISHELQHLLAHHATGIENFSQDIWLSESIAEGAMLLTGYFTDQGHVNRYVENTSKFPLVTQSYVQYGPQLLFASYLIDVVKSEGEGLGFLTRVAKKGREAVEFLFRTKTDTPFSFDAIFGNFLTYLFESANRQVQLPGAWKHSVNGIVLPEIKAYARIEQFPAQLEGVVFPYSFAAVDLAQELPPTALVTVEPIPHVVDAPVDQPPEQNCANSSSTLWKPVSPKRIAIYAIGCEHKSAKDIVQFRLRILDKPSLLPASPLKLLP